MDEFEVLGNLSKKVQQYVQLGLDEYFKTHNTNYFLLYPLISIEIGAQTNKPENRDNLFRRCIAGFLYAESVKRKVKIDKRVINILGLKKYERELNGELHSIFQDFRFAREINDINPFSKAKLTYIEEQKYKLTTSLVENIFEEENIYFFGADDPKANQKEFFQMMELHKKFWQKVFKENNINDLETNIDSELYQLCIDVVEKDLNKWLANVKSKIFSHPKQLSKVLGYIYYRSMVKSVQIAIDMSYTQDIYSLGKDMLIVMQKNECIEEICKISGIKRHTIQAILESINEHI